MTSLRVQVSVPSAHDHPGPPKDVGVKEGGKLAVTLTVPLLAPRADVAHLHRVRAWLALDEPAASMADGHGYIRNVRWPYSRHVLPGIIRRVALTAPTYGNHIGHR